MSGLFALMSLLFCASGVAFSLKTAGGTSFRSVCRAAQKGWRRKKADKDFKETAQYFVQLARRMKQKGPLLGAEEELHRVRDPLVRKGLLLVMHGLPPKLIETMMHIELEAAARKTCRDVQLLTRTARVAMFWGAAGTAAGAGWALLSLAVSASPVPGTVFALTSLAFGLGLGKLIIRPLAARLLKLAKKEHHIGTMVIAGLIGLRNELNPQKLADKLESYVYLSLSS